MTAFRIALFALLFPAALSAFAQKKIVTVNGPVPATAMGFTLSHEHILVDFIGAKHIRPGRYQRDSVIRKALPHLLALRKSGCKTLVDCTPAYLGRDPQLLKMLSRKSGLQILTNTGYYGASGEKYLPGQAYTETAAQLAGRWVKEYKNGIDGMGIRPGFIKLAADKAPLSAVQQKMIEAGAIAHRQTGLTVAVHSGNGAAAKEELAILQKHGVKADAFIWVHAQNEHDFSVFRELARQGAWVSFDGLSPGNVQEYVAFLRFMKQNNLLKRVLLSHDSGWYHVGEPDGGIYKGYTVLAERLIPQLKANGFTAKEIDQLVRINPAEAFTISKRIR